MAIGGIAELAFGVKAEQKPLEQIARPLTAQEAEGEGRGPRRSRERRYRPGPGYSSYGYPGMRGAAETPPVPMDREVDAIAHALEQNGPTDRGALARLVGARHWGPGRFRGALVAALVEERIRRVGRGRFDATAH
jgi:hypothetical protein